MVAPPYERSVFINCPFDADYAPILEAIEFCLIFLGYEPRVATERNDSGEGRIDKILELLAASKFSIHDLSRSQAAKVGELFRLNMPFELGIDVGCRRFGSAKHRQKRILILEKEQYRYKAALSDIGGVDIQAHGERFDIAIRKVRNWLVSEAGIHATGASRIVDAYDDFRAWNFKELVAKGFSEEDARDYPTTELLKAMKDWLANGRPV